MKRQIILLSLLAVAITNASAKQHRYKGHIMQYISGNCRDGQGVAIVSMNSIYKDDIRNQLRYTGAFKDSLMDGEGIGYKTSSSIYISGEKTKIYKGHFSEGDMDGYMAVWLAKGPIETMTPDSAEQVSFILYDRGIVDEEIDVLVDGTTVNLFGSKEYINGRRDDKRKIKDAHLKELAAGYIAARKGNFFTGPTATPAIIAVKTVNVAKGNYSKFIDWDCLTDRKYFVTASALTKNHQMPFGGSVTYRAVSSTGEVVFEAPVDTYFTPPKPGKYSFQVLFDQNVIGDGINVRVDGVQLDVSLRSRSL